MSGIGYLAEKAGRLFGKRITRFQKYHYRNKGEKDSQIYKNAAPLNVFSTPKPTSYWLGHASLLLNLPLKSKSGKIASFNVITDPVEKDLNKILYPRKTKFARSMDRLPAPHVYLLSHNHLDHFEKRAIKKLRDQQPMMVVPDGDGDTYRKLGFKDVVELNWWENQTLKLRHRGETFSMNICATPARHWAGQGPCKGHESTFLGYVLSGIVGGDLYFAGDTARLNGDHVRKLREMFNIKWNFQPGGPDEVRKDMESTHQSSADGLWMHFELTAKRFYTPNMEKETFLDLMGESKTVYMHTMAFKLGNLHLSDTVDSLERIYTALETKKSDSLRFYEKKVYSDLVKEAKTLRFSRGEPLTPTELATLLRQTVAVPKIGSRMDLSAPLNPSDLFTP